MAPETEVDELQEVAEVTFYNWLGADENGRHFPSGQIIHISGGQTNRAEGGTKGDKVPVVEARFHNGIYKTGNPEIIAGLRKLIKRGNSAITEDREEFYKATLTAKESMKRQVALNEKIIGENDELLQENTRMRQMLEAMGEKV